MSSVRASKGRSSAAIGDFSGFCDVDPTGYAGKVSSLTRKMNTACKTSMTWRKLWYGTKALYAARQDTKKPVKFSDRILAFGNRDEVKLQTWHIETYLHLTANVSDPALQAHVATSA